MIINFYPEYDNAEFEKATKEYAKIWTEEGDRITKTIEKVSGLKFKEKIINAIIYGRISLSHPLQLQSGLSLEEKRGTITHELCHRLLWKNKIKWEKIKGKNGFYLLTHRPVDLILYDIWVELYEEDFAKKHVKHEINLWNEKGISPYKAAWDWALSMTKEQRQKLWRKYLKK
ncbi:MAG: hypothetical protein M1405_02015 [Patescibacteria group bacterium]|nr:hypothetical protein [Patescibacteria group bacterium]